MQSQAKCSIFMDIIHLQSIYISRVTEGGVADRDGKLAVGDRIISVSVWSVTSHFYLTKHVDYVGKSLMT